MKIFPFTRFTLESRLPPATLRSRLSSAIGENTLDTYFDEPSAFFFGRSDARSFKVQVATKHRNTFAPVLTGDYEPSARGTKVHVSARLDYLITGVTIIALLAIAFIMFGPKAAEMDPDVAFQTEVITMVAPIVVVTLPMALVLIFWRQTRRAKEHLIELFDAVHIDSD